MPTDCMKAQRRGSHEAEALDFEGLGDTTRLAGPGWHIGERFAPAVERPAIEESQRNSAKGIRSASRRARALSMAASIFMRLRTIPSSCISRAMSRSKPCDDRRLEATERSEALAFHQDRAPREPRLKASSTSFEQSPVVRDRHPPFLVVVARVCDVANADPRATHARICGLLASACVRAIRLELEPRPGRQLDLERHAVGGQRDALATRLCGTIKPQQGEPAPSGRRPERADRDFGPNFACRSPAARSPQRPARCACAPCRGAPSGSPPPARRSSPWRTTGR